MLGEKVTSAYRMFLAGHVRAELVHDQLEILDGSEAPGDTDIDLDEMVEVPEPVPIAQSLLGVGRQVDAVTFSQHQQGGRLDGAFQVHVQLRFRRGGDVFV